MTAIVALALMQTAQPGKDVWTITNREISITASQTTGRFNICWSTAGEIDDIFGSVRLANGQLLTTNDFPSHSLTKSSVRDSLGQAQLLTMTDSGSPTAVVLRRRVWLYRNQPEAYFQLELDDPTAKGTNQITPLTTEAGVRLTHSAPLNSLFVPYDNDSYFRFSSDAWKEPEGSYEVGALYDDQSRNGIVVGSIDHDLWKSAIKFDRQGGLLAYCGVTSKYTHDAQPHGTVTGRVVRSPRFVVGLYKDWRSGLERYGDLNAKVQPPLKWNGAVPFGWNSWSGHKDKVNLAAMDGALDYLVKEIPWLRSGNTAYVNFDSFWDNLSRDQRVAFVKRVHAAGLKAGVYWSPFVNWGEPDWKSVGPYHFREMQLKDGNGALLPKLDGGWPLDPTHPGTLQRIDENLKDFIDQGFDYIKLDFLTHGALEAKHFDPKIETGTAAYRVGMQRIVDDLSKANTFISLSIAPMFPSGYAHSRRISCDVFANIGASEYFLNSQTYAWWTANRLYRFNDPDSACVYQPLGETPTTEAEARTRFTASVIGGGMMIEGDNLTNPAAQERVKEIFSNRAALDLARKTPQFRPVSGTTGDKAGTAFICRQSPTTAYIAAFNFSKTETTKLDLPFNRLNLPTGSWTTENLWTHQNGKAINTVTLTIAPTDCALIRLSR